MRVNDELTSHDSELYSSRRAKSSVLIDAQRAEVVPFSDASPRSFMGL